MPLALTRKVDPLAGDRSVSAVTRTWEEPATPELAVVQNVLRTPLGSAARDPSYGVKMLDNAAPNAAAVWRQNVLSALKRWIDRGVLRDVTVDAEVSQPDTGATLAYSVSFRGRSSTALQTFADTV